MTNGIKLVRTTGRSVFPQFYPTTSTINRVTCINTRVNLFIEIEFLPGVMMPFSGGLWRT